jgi:hypothetical protein
MIKADLSVDGMGNLHINLEKCTDDGIKLSLLSDDKLNIYLGSELKKRGIPIGPKAGVVVTEFLKDKIADPSYEIYNPPKEWNILPFIYYSCGMIIDYG